MRKTKVKHREINIYKGRIRERGKGSETKGDKIQQE